MAIEDHAEREHSNDMLPHSSASGIQRKHTTSTRIYCEIRAGVTCLGGRRGKKKKKTLMKLLPFQPGIFPKHPGE